MYRENECRGISRAPRGSAHRSPWPCWISPRTTSGAASTVSVSGAEDCSSSPEAIADALVGAPVRPSITWSRMPGLTVQSLSWEGAMRRSPYSSLTRASDSIPTRSAATDWAFRRPSMRASVMPGERSIWSGGRGHHGDDSRARRGAVVSAPPGVRHSPWSADPVSWFTTSSLPLTALVLTLA